MSSLSAGSPWDDLFPLQGPRLPEDRQELPPVRPLRQGLLRLRRQGQGRQGLALVVEPQGHGVFQGQICPRVKEDQGLRPLQLILGGPQQQRYAVLPRSWRQSSSPP